VKANAQAFECRDFLIARLRAPAGDAYVSAMLSNDFITELGHVDREIIAQRLEQILDSCARGDIPGIMRHMTPDIVYTGGTWRIYPLMNRCEGARACAEMMHAIHVAFESHGSAIKHLLIQGAQVALCRTTKLRNRGSGRFGDIDIWNFVRFRDGLVCEFSEYPDTLAIAALED
jgi:ketosteroid isomerase-like protein